MAPIPGISVMGMTGAAAGLSYTLANTANSLVAQQTTSRTFSALSIGAAPSASQTRFVIVCWDVHRVLQDSNRALSSVTIGGTAATHLVGGTFSSSGRNPNCGVSYRSVSSGTTADIVISVTNTSEIWGVSVFSLIVPSHLTISSFDTFLTSSASATVNGGIDIPVNGFLFAAGASDEGPSSATTGLVGVQTVNYTSIINYTGSHLDNHFNAGYSERTTTETNRNISFTQTGAQAVGLAAVSFALV